MNEYNKKFKKVCNGDIWAYLGHTPHCVSHQKWHILSATRRALHVTFSTDTSYVVDSISLAFKRQLSSIKNIPIPIASCLVPLIATTAKSFSLWLGPIHRQDSPLNPEEMCLFSNFLPLKWRRTLHCSNCLPALFTSFAGTNGKSVSEL